MRHPRAPRRVVQASCDLYAKLATAADEQIKLLPTYDHFLCERLTRYSFSKDHCIDYNFIGAPLHFRLYLFMVLKEYADSQASTLEITSAFSDVWQRISQLIPQCPPPAGTLHLASAGPTFQSQ